MPELSKQIAILREPTSFSSESAYIREIIGLKKLKTDRWVHKNFPGCQAAFFDKPYDLQHLDQEVLLGLGTQIAHTIVNAFGDDYPYDNKYPDFNAKQLKGGKYLPYFGFILPKGISLEELLYNPVLFEQYKDQVILAATASFLEDGNGFAELARDARRQTINGSNNEFNGGIPSLSRIADWLDNKDGLAYRYHTLFSQIRACDTHGHTPSSGAVQTLQIKNGGMKISYHAPMFVVGDKIETDFGVRRTRDEQAQVELNRDKTFYTFAGNHTQDVSALWRHQLGKPPTGMNVIDAKTLNEYNHPYATVKDHGENIYGAIEVHNASYARNNGHDLVSLNQAITLLDQSSPSILVKVPAETEESALTQKYLTENLGFTPCGIEPALETTYWENGEWKVHKSPITIIFAKLGKRAREKQIEVVPTLFLDGQNNEAIYDYETGLALRNIDRNIRKHLNNECNKTFQFTEKRTFEFTDQFSANTIIGMFAISSFLIL